MMPSWIENIPKVEIHLHLEGAIPLPALWELIKKYGGDPRVSSYENLPQKFIYDNFLQFIDTWIWKNQFIREYEDFTWIAEAVASDLLQQNVRYAECFFSPTGFAGHGLKTQKIAEAIRLGLDRVPKIEIGLIADLVRDSSMELAGRTLAEIIEVKSFGVIGVGIGGPELGYPPERFAGIYEKARQFGLHTTAHAGEAAGPESIWGAIRSLKVERIGHGTRAEEDPALVEYLVEKRVPLEMCPISNLRTKVVPSVKDLPMKRYLDLGIAVTISTDDPKMFGNSLADEYRLLLEEQHFSNEDIRTTLINSAQFSWASDEKKLQLIKEIMDFDL